MRFALANVETFINLRLLTMLWAFFGAALATVYRFSVFESGMLVSGRNDIDLLSHEEVRWAAVDTETGKWTEEVSWVAEKLANAAYIWQSELCCSIIVRSTLPKWTIHLNEYLPPSSDAMRWGVKTPIMTFPYCLGIAYERITVNGHQDRYWHPRWWDTVREEEGAFLAHIESQPDHHILILWYRYSR